MAKLGVNWFIALVASVATIAATLFVATAAKAKCDTRNFRVAIDIGHTPEAQGAMSARGIPEYNYNKLLASSINERASTLGFSVTKIFARGRGQHQLGERISQAETYRPNLLLSIHHDSVQSIYMSRWMFEGREHQYSDLFSGYSIFVSTEGKAFAASITFARLLGSALQRAGFNPSEHHAADVKGERRSFIERPLGIYAFDELYVLKNSSFPTVLLEAGVIVNRDEELSIGSPVGRERLSKAVVSAIEAFCAIPQ